MIDEKTRLIMKSLTALYVEDEEEIKEQLLQSFNRKFKKVYTASDGLEGLEAYEKLNPDLIITDVKMPNMDGLSMIEKIREKDEMIPILTITAYSDVESIKRALELSVDRFIQKPPSKKELDVALYKATLSIIKQKVIEDKDKIIKTILGWEPYFSIICTKENIEHVTSDFLKFIGFSCNDTFLECLHKMKWNIRDENGVLKDIKFLDKQELFDRLSKSDEEFILEINNEGSEEYKTFLVKCKYFEHTKLYLLSLFKDN